MDIGGQLPGVDMSNCRPAKQGMAENRACILSKVLQDKEKVVEGEKKKTVTLTYFFRLSNVSL